MLGQGVVLEHPRDVEILDDDTVVVLGEHRRRFVNEVLASVGDVGVDGLDSLVRAPPPVRGSHPLARSLTARCHTLGPSQPGLVAQVVARVGHGEDLFAITSSARVEGRDTQVDPDHPLGGPRCW